MSDRKKALIVGIVVVFGIMLTGIGFVIADGPTPFCGEGFHSKFYGNGKHRWSHKQDFTDHVLNYMDRRVEPLNLSESQTEQYSAIKAKIKSRLDDKVMDREMFFEDLKKEMNRETPDIEKIATSVKGRIDVGSSFIKEHLDYFVEFYNILDDKQKRQIVDCFKNRIDDHA